LALWRVLDITSGALRAPSSTHHKIKQPNKKARNERRPKGGVCAKPLANRPLLRVTV